MLDLLHQIVLAPESDKVGIYYASEPFFGELIESDGIRLATVEEIIAMKVDVV